MLMLKNVSKTFQDIIAVSDLNLHLIEEKFTVY